ncbi:MAG: hypothetical protein MJ249_12965 [Kiritimatiellae bacterium]|nr:hypothetical protein [Kiritimatiellia bacterium]
MVTFRKSSCLLAGLALFAGVASAGVTALKDADNYRVKVDADSFYGARNVYLVWDTADKGGVLGDWTGKRLLSNALTSAGAELTLPVTEVPDGSVVRAIVTESFTSLDGSVLINNNQYINTGFPENQCGGADFKFNITGKSTNWASVFSGTLDKFTIGLNNSNLNKFYLRYNGADNGPAPTIDNATFGTMVIRDKKWYVNGTVQTWNSGKSSEYNSAIVYSGGSNPITIASDAGHSRFVSGNWWYVHVYNQYNAFERNMWPVKKGGVVGFWDWTYGKFYTTPAGTGISTTAAESGNQELVMAVSSVVAPTTAVKTATWIGGGETTSMSNPANWECRDHDGNVVDNALPTADTDVTMNGNLAFSLGADDTFTVKSLTMNCTLSGDSEWRGRLVTAVGEQLEYISVARGVFVNTGVKPTPQTHIAFDAKPVDASNGVSCYYFGCWDSNWNRSAFAFCNDGNGTYTGWGNNANGGNTAKMNATRHLVEIDKGVFKVDGVVRQTFTNTAGFPINNTIYLFAQNRNGTAYHGDNQSTLHFYGCKIWENNVLIRDYVPMRRFSDGKIGLYERVSRTFADFRNGSRGSYGAHEFLGATGTVVYDVPHPFLPAGATIDTAGHTLTWAPSGTTPFATTVTSSVANGKLALDIAENQSFNNSQVALTGSLRVEKLGAGTFTATKTGTSYTGGTDILAGKVVTGGNPGNLPFGGKTGSQNALVYIRSDAVLDLNGQTAWGWHKILLDGGVLTGYSIQPNFGLELLSDSTIAGTGDFGQAGGDNSRGINPVLNGHTLCGEMANGATTLFLLGATGPGRIEMKSGILRPHNALSAPAVDFDIKGASFPLDYDITVGNYTSSYGLGYNAGAEQVVVTGTFVPLSDYCSGVVMADGSTLDMRTRESAWSSATQGTGADNGALAFADDATITIDLRGRTLALGDQIVAWTAAPANLATLTFQWDAETAAGNVPVMTSERGIFYGADPDSTEVETARWTGAGNDGNVGNAANWECRNAAGLVVADALPGSKTAVTIAGDVNFNFASGAELHGRSLKVNCRLTADADWRGTFTRTARPADFIFLAQGAFFNTMFCPNQNTRVVLDVTVGNAQEYWCGTWNWAYNNGAFALCNDTTAIYTGYGNQGGGTGSSAASVGTRHTVENDKGTIKLDGTVLKTWPANTFQCLYPLIIGGQNRIGMPCARGPNGMRIHSVKVYDNGELVRDYIPLRFEDGTGALWDLVSATCLMPTIGTPDFNNQQVNSSSESWVPKSGYVEAGAVVGTTEYVVEGGLIFADGSTIDLDGHSLTLPGGVPPSGEVAITDTSAGEPGTLTIDVPANYIFWNSRLAISGNLKFVKEGVGIFSSVLPLTYTGGTLVKSGIYRYAGGASAASSESYWKSGVTPAGNANGTVTVADGATVDIQAHRGLGYSYVVEGTGVDDKGVLVSSRDYWAGHQLDILGNVTLAGDAKFGTAVTFHKRTIALNGHTLTIVKGESFAADTEIVDEGKLVIDIGGNVKFEPYDLEKSNQYVGFLRAENAELEVKAGSKLSLKGSVYVKDFTMAGSEWHDTADARRKEYRVYVSGRYSPLSATQPPVMFTGTAGVLDLSTKEDVWPAGTIVPPPEGTMVSVGVAFGGHSISNGQKVASWTTKPARMSFRPIGLSGSLTAKDDGLYYYTGVMIIIR